ncbi:MAG: diaminopimelate decarboxylase [Clostridia bacterium]|nr:diaminopimelate decarboxylase [Clostridia bacterium]
MNFRDTLYVNENGKLIIGGVQASVLAKQFGTPLYVLDKKHVENMCDVFIKTLSKEYPKSLVCYASKAFSCKEIYRIINSKKLGIDVVSNGELYTAKSVDFPMNKAIFHGNNKTANELITAVTNGVKYVVLDSYYEVDLLEEICVERGIKQNVLIRVNPGIEAHTHHYIQTAKQDSKFGFSISNGDALEFIKYVLTKKNVNIEGLHCHIGSQIFEEKSYVICVEKMTDFYKLLKQELSLTLPTINLGGGFGIWYNDEDKKTTLEDYANFVKIIAKTLKENVKAKGLTQPFLILEPGRSIIGEAGITLYTVGATKTIKDLKNYIAIDGGMFDNPRFALYQAKYTVALCDKANLEPVKKYTVAGKCCESGDVIAEDCMLPEVNSGDILAVFSTGAYNYSMASNYNRNLVPPVVMVEKGKAKYIVKPQSLDDLIRNDV